MEQLAHTIATARASIEPSDPFVYRRTYAHVMAGILDADDCKAILALAGRRRTARDESELVKVAA